MKLAYLSYEFPPDTAFGGIATYVAQVSRAMHRRGHAVEVFCASPGCESLDERLEDGISVHRLGSKDRKSFRRDVACHFAQRHAAVGFDLVESPEYGADGLVVKQQLPELPMAVRCHTPGYFVKRLNKTFRSATWQERVKKILPLRTYQKERDPEYQIAMLADSILSPSASLADRIAIDWGIERNRIDVVPYVFMPQRELLEVPLATNTRAVTFLGRLEVRKGVVALSEAIPLVLRRHPDAIFRFVGKSCAAPTGRGSMIDYLKSKLAQHRVSLEFIDHVPLSDIADHLARTDVCVFPSLWENYPNVCLEAMSAGRGIVASREGGMKDMLEDIDGGMLIDPTSREYLANALIQMLDDPDRRQQMGARSRAKILDYYAGKVISATESQYADTIARARESRTRRLAA